MRAIIMILTIYFYSFFWSGISNLRAQQKIVVGKNVHVSKAMENIEHGEVILAADPDNPNNLIGASMLIWSDLNKFATVVYSSFDGGRTWRQTLETSRYNLSGDPTLAYGPDGKAYFVIMASEIPRSVLGYLGVFASEDDGRTWQLSSTIPNTEFDFLDREFITVDNTGGKYHGRIYVHALGSIQAFDGNDIAGSINLYRSYDGGKSFNGPVKRISTDTRYPFAPGNSTILSDGTLVIVFPEIKDVGKKNGPIKIDPSKSYASNCWLKVMTSSDGGESLNRASLISDFFLDWEGGPAGPNSFLPSIASDPGSKYFNDRVYVVWPDNRSGRSEIMLSYSKDKGQTWSLPKVIGENMSFNYDNPSKGPNDFSPIVSVNKAGVVGVSWYDRRDYPDNLGYDVRFTASFDGGDTFLPSVRVSESPHLRTENDPISLIEGGGGAYGGVRVFQLYVNMFYYSGGHTAGMTAAASGRFHPLWIYNRTGLAQVWTAPVTVTGEVYPNGSKELAEYIEISDKIEFSLSGLSFDRSQNKMSVTAEIINTSKKTIYGPVKVRLTDIKSDLGKVHIVNADNGIEGHGALVDYTGLLNNGELRPGARSKAKTLVFKLGDTRPLWQNNMFKYKALLVQSKILAKALK